MLRNKYRLRDSQSQVARQAHFWARWKIVFTYLEDVIGSPQYLSSSVATKAPS